MKEDTVHIEESFVLDSGGVWEDKEWEIYKNYKHEFWDESELFCKHAHSKTWIVKNDFASGGLWEITIPYVVIATNEGGYNTTGVCLQCILEAAKKLEVPL